MFSVPERFILEYTSVRDKGLFSNNKYVVSAKQMFMVDLCIERCFEYPI